jgi:peroxiredoxin
VGRLTLSIGQTAAVCSTEHRLLREPEKLPGAATRTRRVASHREIILKSGILIFCMNATRNYTLLALLLAAAGYSGVPQFRLRDTQGSVHMPAEWAGRRAILLFFVTTDCPVANSYVPEMNRIHEQYSGRGVLVYAVQADTTVAEPVAARYAREFRYAFPLLLDPQQTLVRLAGASVTPQAAVLSPEGKVLYLGRIDNRVQDFGKQRFDATERDLRDALDAVLAGKPVAHPLTKSIGCAINPVKAGSR